MASTSSRSSRGTKAVLAELALLLVVVGSLCVYAWGQLGPTLMFVRAWLG